MVKPPAGLRLWLNRAIIYLISACLSVVSAFLLLFAACAALSKASQGTLDNPESINLAFFAGALLSSDVDASRQGDCHQNPREGRGHQGMDHNAKLSKKHWVYHGLMLFFL